MQKMLISLVGAKRQNDLQFTLNVVKTDYSIYTRCCEKDESILLLFYIQKVILNVALLRSLFLHACLLSSMSQLIPFLRHFC